MKYFKLLLFILLLFFVSGCGQAPSITEDNLITKSNQITSSNLDEYTIILPDTENEYSFLFLTDTHIIATQQYSDKQINAYANERLSIFPNNNISFFQWIDYANTKQFDALLLGGDIIDFPSPANVSYLHSSLEQLQIPYLYTLGNHDWTYPWEYMTDIGKQKYLPLLSPYMENNTDIHILEYHDFTVVAIDNSSNQISSDTILQYQELLSRNKPILLLLHVPLYTESVMEKANQVWDNAVILGGGTQGGIYPNSISAEFIHITVAKDSPVFAILAGHVHFSDKGIIEGEKNTLQIVGDASYKEKGTIIKITNK